MTLVAGGIAIPSTDEDTKTPPTSPANLTTAALVDDPFCCECRSAMEEEAIGAVREYAFAVDSISISEMLPRTSDLLFINITTLENATFCVELTAKGWRIASHRQDCMNGDFRQIQVHTQYFETLAQLLDTISPLYREQFGAQLMSKLHELKGQQESGDSI